MHRRQNWPGIDWGFVMQQISPPTEMAKITWDGPLKVGTSQSGRGSAPKREAAGCMRLLVDVLIQLRILKEVETNLWNQPEEESSKPKAFILEQSCCQSLSLAAGITGSTGDTDLVAFARWRACGRE